VAQKRIVRLVPKRAVGLVRKIIVGVGTAHKKTVGIAQGIIVNDPPERIVSIAQNGQGVTQKGPVGKAPRIGG